MTATGLPSFRSLTHAAFLDAVRELGLPDYQAGVIKQFFWKHGVRTFAEITPLSLAARETLASRYAVGFPTVVERVVGEDSTTKLLLEWEDALCESVVMPSAGRDGDGTTLCLSTQSGCPLGCAFCASGRMAFRRNLTCAEILDQVLLAAGEGAVERIVVMGMGEPLANVDELVPALEFVLSPKGLGYSRKRVTVSTIGLLDGLRRFAQSGLNVELAVSLHAVDDATRARLMPATRQAPLTEVLETAHLYGQHARARVTIEYLLLDGVNDSDDEARGLAEFSRQYDMPVNVIHYNPVEHVDFRPSPRLEAFVKLLAGRARGVTVRRSKGAAIHAACGQLAGRKKE